MFQPDYQSWITPFTARSRAAYSPRLPPASFLSLKCVVASHHAKVNDDTALDVAALSASLRDSQTLAHSQARVSALLGAMRSSLSLLSQRRLAHMVFRARAVPHHYRTSGFYARCRLSLRDRRLALSQGGPIYSLSPPLPHKLCVAMAQYLDRPSLGLDTAIPTQHPALLHPCGVVQDRSPIGDLFCRVFRDAHRDSLRTSLPVSVEECWRMALHHKCLSGPSQSHPACGAHLMSCISSFLLSPSDVAPIIRQRSLTVSHMPPRCILDITMLFHKAPVGDLSECAYGDGLCTLAHGSLLIWVPDREERCGYTLVSHMTGELSDGVWISRDHEFALSWANSSVTVEDCDHNLILTDQGSGAASLVARSPRVGLFTSNQLSAQLLAVESASLSAMGTLFRNALRTLCDRTDTISVALQAALYVHPTLTMRALLGRQDIEAFYFDDGYIQVRRCVSLPSSALSFLPFNTTCYTFPQTRRTGVIHKQGTTVACSSTTPFLFPFGNGVHSFDPHSGTWSSFSPREVTKLPSAPSQEGIRLAPPLTVFHNLILTNFTETSNDQQLHELWVARDHFRLVYHFVRLDDTSTGGHGSVRDGYFASRFVRSLFPRRFVGTPSPTNKNFDHGDSPSARHHRVPATRDGIGRRAPGLHAVKDVAKLKLKDKEDALHARLLREDLHRDHLWEYVSSISQCIIW
ncbi:hypothetical protein COOONC_08584 [Cooperia oncophora]